MIMNNFSHQHCHQRVLQRGQWGFSWCMARAAYRIRASIKPAQSDLQGSQEVRASTMPTTTTPNERQKLERLRDSQTKTPRQPSKSSKSVSVSVKGGGSSSEAASPSFIPSKTLANSSLSNSSSDSWPSRNCNHLRAATIWRRQLHERPGRPSAGGFWSSGNKNHFHRHYHGHLAPSPRTIQ